MVLLKGKELANDMSLPLLQYWINTSYDTYLTSHHVKQQQVIITNNQLFIIIIIIISLCTGQTSLHDSINARSLLCQARYLGWET